LDFRFFKDIGKVWDEFQGKENLEDMEKKRRSEVRASWNTLQSLEWDAEKLDDLKLQHVSKPRLRPTGGGGLKRRRGESL
jgi:hypothetical protein